jgi:hypothetical protein
VSPLFIPPHCVGVATAVYSFCGPQASDRLNYTPTTKQERARGEKKKTERNGGRENKIKQCMEKKSGKANKREYYRSYRI